MAKPKKKTGTYWLLCAIMLLSFVVLLYLSSRIAAMGAVTLGVDVVIIGIIMAFVSYVLGKLYG